MKKKVRIKALPKAQMAGQPLMLDSSYINTWQMNNPSSPFGNMMPDNTRRPFNAASVFGPGKAPSFPSGSSLIDVSGMPGGSMVTSADDLTKGMTPLGGPRATQSFNSMEMFGPGKGFPKLSPSVTPLLYDDNLFNDPYGPLTADAYYANVAQQNIAAPEGTVFYEGKAYKPGTVIPGYNGSSAQPSGDMMDLAGYVGPAMLAYTDIFANIGKAQKQGQARLDFRDQTLADNLYMSTPEGYSGNRGDYTLNYGIGLNFRPDEAVYGQFGKIAKYGGQMKRKIRITSLPQAAYGGTQNKVAVDEMYPTTDLNRMKNSASLFGGEDESVRQYMPTVPREIATVEAEKGETIVTPGQDGIPNMYKIGGKRHSQGGTPIQAGQGDFIFSDTKDMKIKDPAILESFGMRLKKGGYTPAQISKKFNLNNSDLQKTLNDPKADLIARTTAERMMDNNLSQLGKLALVQEARKGFPQGPPSISMAYMQKVGLDPSMFMPDVMTPQDATVQMGKAQNGVSVERAPAFFYNKDTGRAQALVDLPGGNYGYTSPQYTTSVTPPMFVPSERLQQSERAQRSIAMQRAQEAYEANKASAQTSAAPVASSSATAATTTSATTPARTQTPTTKVVPKPAAKATKSSFTADEIEWFKKGGMVYMQDGGEDTQTETQPTLRVGKNPNTGKPAVFKLNPDGSYTVLFETFVGSKKTPTGVGESWQGEGPALKRYIQTLSERGIDLSNINSASDFQTAIYDQILAENPESIEKMWNTRGLTIEGTKYPELKSELESLGVRTSLGVGDIRNAYKLDFSKLDAEGKKKALELLKKAYVDDKIGVRTLSLDFKPEVPEEPGKPGEPDKINDYTQEDLPDQGKSNKPTDFYIQDLLNYRQAMADRLGINKYMPYRAAIPQPRLMEPTYYDPSRELAATAEMTNIAAQNLSQFTGPQAFNTRYSDVQGKAAANVANILGRYNNLNVGVANEFERYNSALINDFNIKNALSMQDYYDKTVVANQQYDNSKRIANNRMNQQFTNALTNRAMTQVLNQMYPEYYVHPLSGGMMFFNPSGRQLTPSSGSSNSLASIVKQLETDDPAFANLDTKEKYNIAKSFLGKSDNSDDRSSAFVSNYMKSRGMS